MPIFQRILILYSLVFTIFLFSCRAKSKTDKEILTAVNATLTNSSLSIQSSSAFILAAIRERATDPISSEKAGPWLPKAELITKLSTVLVNYIKNFKKEKQIRAEQSGALYEALVKYKKDILDVDSLIRYEFEKIFILVTDLYETLENGKDKFYSKFFKNASQTGASAMLSNLLNSVTTTENKLLSFCISRTTHHILHDHEYFPALLVGQNSTYLKQGEILEIQAGVGSFSHEPNISAIINGKKIPAGDGGYFTYKIKISGKPGKYEMPVQISFLNSTTGKDETKEVIVKYTVAKECDQ